MLNPSQGIIVKIDSDKSWVFAWGETYKVDIKKTLLRTHQPAVGDRVWFEINDHLRKTGVITSFKKRDNFLPKPRMANVDQILVVTSLSEPDFNPYLLNKYLFFLATTEIKPVLIFTKSDLLKPQGEEELLAKITAYKDLGYVTIVINDKNFLHNGFKNLKKILKHKISVLVGQTGAGKSTIINWFLDAAASPLARIKTQPISKALNRGKHTTTTTQLYPLSERTLIADTPGFGNFKLSHELKLEKINRVLLNKCGYPNCTHSEEPSCVLKNGQLSQNVRFIYEDYCRLINEIKTTRGKKYEKNKNNA